MSKVTAMDNTMEVEAPKRTLSSRQKVMAGFALMVLTQGVFAAAPTSGEFLFGVYDEIMGWLTGAPGIIISILTFGFAGFQGIVKQNYAACIGAFLIALLFANAQDAIEYFLTASVGVPL